jgi:hypothetical protein
LLRKKTVSLFNNRGYFIVKGDRTLLRSRLRSSGKEANEEVMVFTQHYPVLRYGKGEPKPKSLSSVGGLNYRRTHEPVDSATGMT